MATNTGAAAGYSSVNITGQATTLAKTGSGILHTVTFNKPTATTVVTIYDSLLGSGTKIGTITIPASPMPVTLTYDAVYSNGLTFVTGTADSDITATFI